MSPKKETTMVLEVDFDCTTCYKKVKKLLCQYPQIRDQIYDEEKCTVTIKVWCCSPEKIRDKLCSKAGKCIKSIEILKPTPAKKVKQEPAKTTTNQEASPEKPTKPTTPALIPGQGRESYLVSATVNVCCYEGQTFGHCSCHRFGYSYRILPPPPPMWGGCCDRDVYVINENAG